MLENHDRTERRILIVEDDSAQRAVMSAALHKAGYEVTESDEGEEGEARARQLKPDLLILDVMLPGKNGLDICAALKNDPEFQNLPIMLVTVLAENSRHNDAYWRRKSGADDFMTKPFPLAELVWRAAKLLA